MRVLIFFISILYALNCRAETGSVSARDSVPPSEEIWPEINVFYRINERQRLFLLISGTRLRNSYYTDGSIGLHYDYFFNKKKYLVREALDSTRGYNFWVRGGYNYAASPPSDADVFREHTIVTESNNRLYLPDHWLLTARNRLDWRVKEGDFSLRYRPRLNIERDFFTGYATFTAYFYSEYFLNFGKGNLNRFRFCSGVDFRIFRFFSFEFYYLFQTPNDPDVGQVSAVGIDFKFYFSRQKQKKKTEK